MKKTFWRKIKKFFYERKVTTGIDFANSKDKTVKTHFFKNSDGIVKILKIEVLSEKEIKNDSNKLEKLGAMQSITKSEIVILIISIIKKRLI